MEILLLAVAMYWVAAPDRFTAAARTATGQAARAAGSAARGQWVADRGGRQAVRTDRRDRWQRRGENTAGRRFRAWLWRRALGTERALVAAGRASLSGGRLARAAVKPVPTSGREGWRKGQDRHRARTAGRPVPVALDPPWWRQPDPAPVPDETGQDSPQDSETAVEDSPESEAESGQDDEPVTPGWPLVAAVREIPDCDIHSQVEGMPGVPAAYDAETKSGPWAFMCPDCFQRYGTGELGLGKGQHLVLKEPSADRPDAPTDPDTDTPGGTVPPISTELRTHVAVQDFAEQIDRISEASDFVMVAEKARTVGAQSRAGGFGGEMDLAVDDLEAAAKRFAQDVDSLREQAHALTKTSLSVQGS